MQLDDTSNHSVQTDPTTENDFIHIEVIKTKFEEQNTKSISLNDIQTSADLAELKKKDPFMYHSIPAVRTNIMQGKDVDISTLAQASAKTPVVRRRRRISYESIDGAMPSEEILRQMMNDAQSEIKSSMQR